MVPNFSGWATKNDLVCSDGLTIKAGAFEHQDKVKVPLVWQHMHTDPENVLGYAILENRAEGVYTDAFFNESPRGQAMRLAVEHGDVESLSIYANKLRKHGNNVLGGDIKEVSIVLAGANPGARIEHVNIQHGDFISELEDEAVIHTGDAIILHNDSTGDTVAEPSNTSEKTVAEVIETMDEEQKQVLAYMVGEALQGGSDDGEDGDDLAQSDIDMDALAHGVSDNIIKHFQEDPNMARNLFETHGSGSGAGNGTAEKTSLSHSELQTIVSDAKRLGSLKESFLQHAGDYGINDIDILFPDAKTLSNTPELIARQAEWVPKVLNATKHSPFAKIKSIVADLTADEARAKGYIKGNEKKDEVIELLKRTTSPTTIYKKQKLDRDDIIDIVDLDIVAWLKWEIRFMLNEEIARAILIGDGRVNSSEDKIKDPAGVVDGIGVRSILKDHELYAHKVELAANVNAENIVDEITRARTFYRGSGSPSLYTTDKVLTDLLLLKDKMGRRLYDTIDALASALRVKEIVPVEVMEQEPTVLGIVVNLTDYSVGSNKGGELTFFEDFDIDYNQHKYLMETRMSGALTKPKSALVITRLQGTLATATAPSFNGGTNTITIPTATGVNYRIDGTIVTGTKVITENTTVTADAKADYYLAANATKEWAFSYTAP